jgi:hypothetical protein
MSPSESLAMRDAAIHRRLAGNLAELCASAATEKTRDMARL